MEVWGLQRRFRALWSGVVDSWVNISVLELSIYGLRFRVRWNAWGLDSTCEQATLGQTLSGNALKPRIHEP